MFESVNKPSVETAPEKQKKSAAWESHFRNEDGKSEVSLDGEHFIPVPDRLRKLMRIAYRLQDKVDTAIQDFDLEYNSAVNIVEGMNCHKTALFARGDISYPELVNTSIEAEHNGHPEVISLANENPNNLIFYSEDIEDFIKGDANEFPYSVHVLLQNKNKWTPAHSFLVLGKDSEGNTVCFHKRGPYLDNAFELTTLNNVVGHYDNKPSVFLVLPVPAEAS